MVSKLKQCSIGLGLFVGFSAGFADSAYARRPVVTELEKAMSEQDCRNAIEEYARVNLLVLEEYQDMDFYLMENGERVGNAYHSTGICYIYMDF